MSIIHKWPISNSIACMLIAYTTDQQQNIPKENETKKSIRSKREREKTQWDRLQLLSPFDRLFQPAPYVTGFCFLSFSCPSTFRSCAGFCFSFFFLFLLHLPYKFMDLSVRFISANIREYLLVEYNVIWWWWWSRYIQIEATNLE